MLKQEFKTLKNTEQQALQILKLYEVQMAALKKEVNQATKIFKSRLEKLTNILQQRAADFAIENSKATNPFFEFVRLAKTFEEFAINIEIQFKDFPTLSIVRHIKNIQEAMSEYMVLYCQFQKDENFQDKEKDEFQSLLAQPWQFLIKGQIFYQNALQITIDYHKNIEKLTKIEAELFTQEDFGEKMLLSTKTREELNQKQALFETLSQLKYEIAFLRVNQDEIKLMIENSHKDISSFIPQINIIAANIASLVEESIMSLAFNKALARLSTSDDLGEILPLDMYLGDISDKNIADYIAILIISGGILFDKKFEHIDKVVIENLKLYYYQSKDKLRDYVNHIYQPLADEIKAFAGGKLALDPASIMSFKVQDSTYQIFNGYNKNLFAYLRTAEVNSNPDIKNLLKLQEDNQIHFFDIATTDTYFKFVGIMTNLVMSGRDCRGFLNSENIKVLQLAQDQLVQKANNVLKEDLRGIFDENERNIVNMLVVAGILSKTILNTKKTIFGSHHQASGVSKEAFLLIKKIETYVFGYQKYEETSSESSYNQIDAIFNYIDIIDKIIFYSGKILNQDANLLFEGFINNLNERKKKSEDKLSDIFKEINNDGFKKKNKEVISDINKLLLNRSKKENIDPGELQKIFGFINQLPKAPIKTLSLSEATSPTSPSFVNVKPIGSQEHLNQPSR
jgi:uncharacterized protein (UPF0335 family)